MANTKSAAKRARQSITRTVRNRSVLTGIKTKQKTLRGRLAAKDAATAPAHYQELASALDRAAKRGVIHKNAAARKKSRLARALAAASA